MCLTVVDKENATACVLGGRDRWTAVYTSVDLLVDVAGLLGNLLVVGSVVRYKCLCTATNRFVVALAVSDLLVCLSIPYYVSFYFDVPYVCAKYPCLVRYAVTLYAMIASVLSLVGAATDRYLAVVHALAYPRLVRGRRVTAAVVAIYAYVAVLVLPIFGINTWTPDIPECDLVFVMGCTYALLAVGLHVLVGLVVTLVLYARVFRVAWRQARRVHATHQLHHRLLHREARTALTMAAVLGVHVLSLAPFLVVVVLRYFDKEHEPALSVAKKYVMCLYFAKSAVNPLIYGWKNKEFQWAFKKLLAGVVPTSWRRRSQPPPPPAAP